MSTSSSPQADEKDSPFEGSAPERYEQYSAPVMAPFVAALLDAVDLCPGHQVLDLAAGTGFVARAAAARVGPTGHVVAADPSGPMLKVAAAKAPRMYPDIEFTVAPADRLPQPDDAFDTVLCQQGVQCFPDLGAALAEVSRVLRPGGRFAATVWAAWDRSPYFAAQRRVLTEHGGPSAEAYFAAAFSCPADRLAGALTDAGFHGVTVREVTPDITLPPLAAFVRGYLSAVPWGQAIEDAAGPDGLTAAAEAVTAALADRTDPDGTATVPFTATLVTAIR
ncbi:class I SAM-dependent methyltransferase [Streptomyces beigongshangae]|uniref:class I SAM-dependent methyltransferase n=1 Tax=Streptomyces beigongshangae TaxID=2841597 RepID=UPI0021A470DE|nr:methyltransferase domain-containing protein [Streptomyces sp. REN17]